jgi:hypothetical protein
MTDNPSTTSVRLPDALEADVKQLTQYGLRYPNGDIAWEQVPTYADRNVNVEKLIKSDSSHERYLLQQDWKKHLKAKAEEASIDAAEYAASHQFISRTVVVAVTATRTLDAKEVDIPLLEPIPVPAPAAPWT